MHDAVNAAFGLIVVPTLYMGATLPSLVAHRVRESRNLGASVAHLCLVKTAGSAHAAILPAVSTMRRSGIGVDASGRRHQCHRGRWYLTRVDQDRGARTSFGISIAIAALTGL
jgi:hypothetical protein